MVAQGRTRVETTRRATRLARTRRSDSRLCDCHRAVCSHDHARVGASAAPNLSRQQRDLLLGRSSPPSIGAATAAGRTSEYDWQTHVLRASDGSHYIAFSVRAARAAFRPAHRSLRAPRHGAVQGETAVAERSIVREWLQGARVDPRMLPQRRGVAIGEMPPMGAGAIGVRGGSGSRAPATCRRWLSSANARGNGEEEDEKRRRAELEGSRATPVGPAAVRGLRVRCRGIVR